ncbi:MAG: protein translocase subunit SecD [Lysobacter sp.]|nr:MAG: protein translocase subunit SecD [Lysobacter sp.]
MLTYARWQYAVLVIVLVLSALYALPNAFQKDPSIQISAPKGALVDAALKSRTSTLLRQGGVTPKAIETRDGDLLVRLTGTAEQTRAADVLRPLEADRYQVALSLAPTAPAWLSALNAKSMPLGLDLQGGVHFELQVDQDAALQKQLDTYVEDMRVQLRDAGVHFTGVNRTGAAAIRVNLSNPGEMDKTASSLRQSYPLFVQDVQGTELLLSIPDAEIARIKRDAIEQNLTTLRNRVNSLGVAEPVIQRQGVDRIVVELPGQQDTVEAKRRIGATATLEFRAVVGDEVQAAEAVTSNSIPPGAKVYYDQEQRPLLLSKRVLVSGDQLTNAIPQIDPQSGTPSVSISLNTAGGKRMLEHTLDNVGKRLAAVYVEQIPITEMVNGREVKTTRTEERVISSPVIQGVFGKDFQTTGLTTEEAGDLARQLKSGALAAPMFFVAERVIGPSLGRDNIERGLRAVVFSFAFALLFFLFYYRMFGVITCLALMINLLALVAVMSLFDATLTLPGLAGIALTVGMSVDANVLINERIREELRAGMPPQAAIATGYEKAAGTIADANLTAILAGVALFAFGTGPVKGFAVALIVGILTSMYTAVSASRAIATLIYGGRRKLKSIAI